MTNFNKKSLILTAYLPLLFFCTFFLGTAKAWTQLSQQELATEIIQRLDKVEEFREIKKLAKEMDVKAYLFGGTAAAYAHYVKWDLLREKGDPRFQPDRFDYDYTNIFRSNQDMDIVIDGTSEQAKKLEDHLATKFPFFQGNKSVWEVRLLKDTRGDKGPLLHNPDFLNQHTDSNSTGMIELAEKGAIRDLRDWDNRSNPHFLEDVYGEKLHYYFSENHEKTQRFQKGLNPPILSVIRYLTKAFQYELEIPLSSWEKIQSIIKKWNEKDFAKESSYVQYWMEKNAKKLFQNAVNIEYAWNTLETLGLRQKLAAIGDPKEGGLGWWMNKEPLRSKEIGKTEGQKLGMTAKELGLEIVAHETKSFDAYESITRAHTGEPNVLISRQGKAGENAAFGDGFYTARGRSGMAGTGITLRFKMHPEAREGEDFELVKDDKRIVLIKNKKALTVVPENIQFSTLEYFEKIFHNQILFDLNDRGVAEKVRRKLHNQSTRISEEDVHKIQEILRKSWGTPVEEALMRAWLELPVAKNYPEIFVEWMAKEKKIAMPFNLSRILDTYFTPMMHSWFLLPQNVHLTYPWRPLIGPDNSNTNLSPENFLRELLIQSDLSLEQKKTLMAMEPFKNPMIWSKVLSLSLESKDIKFYSYLIENMPPQENNQNFLRGLLWQAYMLENLEAFKDLLRRGGKEILEVKDYQHNTFLTQIFRNKDSLAALKAPVNERRKDFFIALFEEGGADPNTQSGDGKYSGMAPLMHALYENVDPEIIRLLLDRGALGGSLGKTGDKNYSRPLLTAAKKGNIPIVELLLEKGASLDVQDQDGDKETALLNAVQGQYKDLVHFILAKSSPQELVARINQGDKRGKTPLLAAAQKLDLEIFRILVEKGGNLHARTKEGESIFDELVSGLRGIYFIKNFDAQRMEFFRYFLNQAPDKEDLKKDINRGDKEGNTVLMKVGMVYDVSMVSLSGSTIADENMREEIISLLLEKGANLEQKNKEGKTALEMALKRGKNHYKGDAQFEGARALYAHGAKAPSPDSSLFSFFSLFQREKEKSDFLMALDKAKLPFENAKNMRELKAFFTTDFFKNHQPKDLRANFNRFFPDLLRKIYSSPDFIQLTELMSSFPQILSLHPLNQKLLEEAKEKWSTPEHLLGLPRANCAN